MVFWLDPNPSTVKIPYCDAGERAEKSSRSQVDKFSYAIQKKKNRQGNFSLYSFS